MVTLLTAASAFAQDEVEEGAAEAPAEASAETPTETSEATEAAPATSDSEEGRFRFGINGAVGLESVSDAGASVSGAMFGLDIRLGWQFSRMLAVYLQPHLSFGSLSASSGGATGLTGTFVGTIMGEATFLDRFFGGAGIGYGVLNNPSGFALDFRAGAYPLMGRDSNGGRRTGLMVGIDFRAVFVEIGTGILFMGTIGYESF